MTVLKYFFQPQSVAVLGASHVPGKVGYDVLKNLIQSGYPGKLFPIHPTSSEIQGLKAYPDLLAVDDPIDLLIYLIPPHYILPTLDDCKKKNIEAVIAISAGFKETGSTGAQREREMIRKARELNIRASLVRTAWGSLTPPQSSMQLLHPACHPKATWHSFRSLVPSVLPYLTGL